MAKVNKDWVLYEVSFWRASSRSMVSGYREGPRDRRTAMSLFELVAESIEGKTKKGIYPWRLAEMRKFK